MRRAIGGCLLIATIAGCRSSRPESITDAELSEHAYFLASDALAGRGVGTPGIATAEQYIAGQFELHSPRIGTDRSS